MSQKIIELKNISKEYNGNFALNDISLYINKNEFITFLGPSGCGKTTTLRIIGGFEEATHGEVMFEGKNIASLPPYKRNINTVFQSYALFPHMNIYENIAFGLKIKKIKSNIIEAKVKDMLKLVNLEGFENREVNSLSGGQKQRVAIARALVNEPDVLLLDEPLGALDLKLRKEMQIELKKIQQKLGITFIFVTHDQEEALTMSDTIVVMRDGKIQQIGTPEDIYNEPKNAFVADFIGESTILDGIMHKDFLVEFCGQKFKCVDKSFDLKEKVDVVIRPEDINFVNSEQSVLTGLVESVTFKGVHYEMVVRCNQNTFLVHNTKMVNIGKSVGLFIEPENIHIMKKVNDNE